MKKLTYFIGFIIFVIFIFKFYSYLNLYQIERTENPYKIYVCFGFHTSFRHSWRGDAPDETGVGVDIRVVRKIIQILNKANKKGIPARGTWDFESRWTIEEYIKKYAPDILENIKRRVEAGLDEIVISPYNNGLVAASDKIEFEESIKRAFKNNKKSGLVDIFGKVCPMVRPQEMMFTPGHIKLYNKLGIKYLSLYYSSTPFNSISNFIPKLTIEQQHNPIYLKDGISDERIILIPTYHQGDILTNYSLEKWCIKLRKAQIFQNIKNDLLIYINMDADSEVWTGFDLPEWLSFIPNLTGLYEYIKTVNKLKFVEFTTIEEYMKNHNPVYEITLTQDLADGGWDGFSSWAEKLESSYIWSGLERARYYTKQAEYLLENEIKDNNFKRKIYEMLWGEKNSSFSIRFDLLSTTHFGMSNPVINSERAKQALKFSNLTEKIAYEALKECKKNIASRYRNLQEKDCLYAFYVFNFKNRPSRMFVKIPVLAEGINPDKLKLVDENKKEIPFFTYTKDNIFYILFYPEINGRTKKLFFIKIAQKTSFTEKKFNPMVKLSIDKYGFISSLKYKNIEFAREKFILPFVNYGNKIFFCKKFTYKNLNEEQAKFKTIKFEGKIEIVTTNRKYPVILQYIFIIPEDLPYLFADVNAEFPKTPAKKFSYTMVQKINRLVDLNWIEVAPFQLQPAIFSRGRNFLKIWKINYLGYVSSYQLNYKNINIKNANISSFNNHITAPWVALSNGKKGLLISQSISGISNFAFAPMRLQENNNIQSIFINPYGTYYGKQLDYSHLSKNRTAIEFISAVAPFLKSSAPSYNGGKMNFSLMFAPYEGDIPPYKVREDAMDFFYPCGIIYLKTPFKEKEIIDTKDIVDERGNFRLEEISPENIRKISPISEIKNLNIKLFLKLLWNIMLTKSIL